MDGRVVLVPAHAKILDDPRTEKLHTYPNGSVLIRTTIPVDESGESGETPVAQGIQLEGVRDEDLQAARAKLNTSTRSIKKTIVELQEPILAYVELIGPTDPEWLQKLKDLGVQPLQYQPENSYLCQGTIAAFNEVRKQKSFVLNVTPLTEVMKPRLEILSEAATDVIIVVQATQDEGPSIAQALGALPGIEILANRQIEQIGPYLRIRARVNPDGENAVLKNPRVRAVELYQRAIPEDEVAGLILAGKYDASGKPDGSYLQWLEDHGINGEGVTIGIVDNGVDASHAAFKDRITDLAGGKKSWHGTFVAGHAAGNYLSEKDGNKFIYGIGMACAANILVQDNSDTAASLCKQTVTERGPSGIAGSVQNNSWGKGTQDPMDYRSEEHTYDQLVRNADPAGENPKPLTICFSSGNSGQAGLTRPKSAKNVIITGNSENYRPDVGGGESDNIKEVYTGAHASSWGNCADGRIRPHVVAPGEWTSSANYDSHEGEREYISPRLTWGGGSSGASPKTAGACALLIQWWRKHNAGKEPSPSMLRALIVNGAEPMATGGPAPNMRQGWGRLNLENILSEKVQHIYVDQQFMFTQLGEQKVWKIRLSDPAQPLKITLAWTDPGGPLQSGTQQVDAIVNKLGLSAEVNGVVYQGGWKQEHFQAGWSMPSNSSDPVRVDNLQNIFLRPDMATGTIQVTVKALSITTNCLTGEISTPQQDFALVITNGHLDAGLTPADVFVAVDKAAKSDAKPNTPDNYWNDAPGNSDTQELHADWWQDTNTTAKNGSATSPTSAPVSTGSSDDDDWWSKTEFQWSKPEMERATESRPLSADAGFVRGLKAGFDLLMVGGKNTVLSGLAGPHVEAEREDDHARAVQDSEMELTKALENLMSNWDTFGAPSSGGSLICRRVAVLVVGAGTRVSHEDLDIMRRLTFMGELYLISDEPTILSFLAQRIHRCVGIHFRLANNLAELAQLVRDTLAEVAGAQVISVGTDTQNTEMGVVSKHIFYVVEMDTHLTIRIHFKAEAPINGIKLQRPGQNAIILDGYGSEDIQLLRRPEIIQIDTDAPQDMQGWAGLWTLELMQPTVATENVAVVNVWGRGGPRLMLREQALSPSEAKQDKQEVLVTLSGDPGVTFSRSNIAAPRIATAQPVVGEEEERDIVMAVKLSRLDKEASTEVASDDSRPTAEASRRSASAAMLSEWLRIPRTSMGATVLDIPMQTLGADAHGQRFVRITRSTLIQLEPRSKWRARLSAEKKILLIRAPVTEVQYAEGKVIGLRLSNGKQQRNVTISSTALSEKLASLTLENLSGNSLLFRVSDNELVGVLRLFDGADGS